MVRSRRYVPLSGTRVFPAPADKAGYLARRMVGESIKRIERREVRAERLEDELYNRGAGRGIWSLPNIGGAWEVA